MKIAVYIALRKENIVSCHATTRDNLVKQIEVCPCVCINSHDRPAIVNQALRYISDTWILLKHLTRYKRFGLKGNSSVLLMIKTGNGEEYKDPGGSMSA